jgi:hypothetical protein
MPIANCIVKADCQNSSNNLIELWAEESGVSSEHMTVNIVVSNEQLGNQYSVMATLSLPSAWSNTDISSLQVGLARAIAVHYDISIHDVHVVTHVLNSGLVVEDGNSVKW